MGNHPNENNENNENINNNNDKLNSQLNKNILNFSYPEKTYVWIDPQIENQENTYYNAELFIKKGIKCQKYDNIDEAYKFLIKEENEFKEVIIIISGKLFTNFYYKIKNSVNGIKFSPTIIVFTSKGELFRNHLKMNNIYYINDLFDKKFIFTNHFELEEFINGKIKEENDLTFDIIDNLDQLIIPNYYSYLIEDANYPEIFYFNNYLKTILLPSPEKKSENFDNNIFLEGNEKVQELLYQIEYKKLPKEIIMKYWLRIYSLQSEFFVKLNRSLRIFDKQVYFYFPFIKLCYEGIKKGFIKSYNKEIYRCSKLSKDEFIKIEAKFKESKNSKYPKIIVFSRSFLSYSTDKKQAKKFRGSNEVTFCIFYIIEEIENKQNTERLVSNACIEELSNYKEEKEVLVFPFSCFEIVSIKEIKADDIDYEIRLKYLGNDSKYIKEIFGANFFDNIQISNFSQDLIESGVVPIDNLLSAWEKKDEIKLKIDNICFLLENQEDCVGFSKQEIIVFNIYTSEIKQKINIHTDDILDIVKLSFNRICSYSKDKTIRIIQFNENNLKYIEQYNINLGNHFAKHVLLDFEENIIFEDEENFIAFYALKDKKYTYISRIKEEDNILTMKLLTNNKIIYITENKEGKKLVNFISLIKKEKENNIITIEEKETQMKFIGLLCFYDYIIIGYNYRIDIFNYLKTPFKIKSFNFFDFEIRNMIILSSNRIILGLYDSNKKEYIIREQLLRVEDLQKEIERFDCIGQGNIEGENIENIIKLNESQILTNIKENTCIIYERKNEISENLKKHLKEINKNDELIQKNNEQNIIMKETKKNIFTINKQENFKIMKKNISQDRAHSLHLQPQFNLLNKFHISNQNFHQPKINNKCSNIFLFKGNFNTNNIPENHSVFHKNFHSKEIENIFPEANKETLVIKAKKTYKEQKSSNLLFKKKLSTP